MFLINFLCVVFLFCQVSSENQSYQSEEEDYKDKQENVKYTEGPDKLTVEIMDSTDDPVQRSVVWKYCAIYYGLAVLCCWINLHGWIGQ